MLYSIKYKKQIMKVLRFKIVKQEAYSPMLVMNNYAFNN